MRVLSSLISHSIPMSSNGLLVNQRNTTELLARGLGAPEQLKPSSLQAFKKVSQIQEQRIQHLPGVLSSPSEALIAARAELTNDI